MRQADKQAEYMRILGQLEREFPEFDLLPKEESTLMKAIDILLKIVTFGQMKTFMTDFVTTIGDDVFVPADWEERDYLDRAVTLRHERKHIRQKQRYFRRLKWMSFFWFSMRYSFWIFPAVLAMGRKLYEQEAYEESMRARVQYYGIGVLDDQEYREYIVDHFVSSDYFWTWPFRKSVETWYDSVVHIIRAEHDV